MYHVLMLLVEEYGLRLVLQTLDTVCQTIGGELRSTRYFYERDKIYANHVGRIWYEVGEKIGCLSEDDLVKNLSR